jgi:hypothetical protein
MILDNALFILIVGGLAISAIERNAADVAISTTFGPNVFSSLRFWAEELRDDSRRATA